MDGFTYHNIFETKGIEYLAIILFFLVLIPFWYILNKKTGINLKIISKLNVLSAGSIKIPQGIFFSKNHTWTYLEKKGTAMVGIDDLILHLTGDLKIEKVKEEGTQVNKGDELASFDKNGKTLKIYSPISGFITEKNHDLFHNPEAITDDTFSTGWICRIKPFKWVEETNSYYLAETANEWNASEMERFKDFVSHSYKKYATDSKMVILQTGGEIINDPMANLSPEIWNDFQSQFLDFKA